MKKRYLIAIDLDSTLLDDEKKISEKTKKHIKALEDDGNVIVLATGRPFRAAKPYYDEIGLTGPMICYNGAYVTDPVNHKFDDKISTIKKDIVISVIGDIGENQFNNVMCETNEEAWVMEDNEEFESFFWKENIIVHEGPIKEILVKDPMTTIFVSKTRDIDEKLVKCVFANENLGVRFWGSSNYSELYFLHINKGTEVMSIADAYGIDHENTIAFGDAENDVELLQTVKIGIAMTNGAESLLNQIERRSLGDNNHDGVSKTLEYLLATNH